MGGGPGGGGTQVYADVYAEGVFRLFGAAFLLLVDNMARCLTAVEIPIGILTAFVGAPFFLYLMIKGGERA